MDSFLNPEYLSWTLTGLCLNRCWLVLRTREKYPPVISPGIYPPIPQFSKYSKNWFQYTTMVLKIWKSKKKLGENHQFVASSFMKTIGSLRFLEYLKQTFLWFWIFFQRTWTVVSLILEKFKESELLVL